MQQIKIKNKKERNSPPNAHVQVEGSKVHENVDTANRANVTSSSIDAGNIHQKAEEMNISNEFSSQSEEMMLRKKRSRSSESRHPLQDAKKGKTFEDKSKLTSNATNSKEKVVREDQPCEKGGAALGVKSNLASTNTTSKDEAVQRGKQRRLSGAASKRYKRALKQGCSEEEAYERAMNPKKELAKEKESEKSPNSVHTHQQEKEKTKVDLTATITSSYAEVASLIQLGIFPKDFPEVHLKKTDVALIEDAIINIIIEDEHSDFAPVFKSSEYRTDGWMVVRCKDQKTADWLAANFHRAKFPDKREFKLLKRKDFPGPCILAGFIPDQPDRKRVKSILAAQNYCFKTKGWGIASLSPANKSGSFVRLFVDTTIMESLRKDNWSANYKFGSIKVRRQVLRKSRRSENKAEAPEPKDSIPREVSKTNHDSNSNEGRETQVECTTSSEATEKDAEDLNEFISTGEKAPTQLMTSKVSTKSPEKAGSDGRSGGNIVSSKLSNTSSEPLETPIGKTGEYGGQL